MNNNKDYEKSLEAIREFVKDGVEKGLRLTFRNGVKGVSEEDVINTVTHNVILKLDQYFNTE